MTNLIDKPISETAKTRGVAIGQKRANVAWQHVEEVKALGTKTAEDYAIEAKKLPIRIKASGLGQALAFIRSKAAKSNKDQNAMRTLLKHLNEWVLEKRTLSNTWQPGEPVAEGNAQPNCPMDLLEAIVKGKSAFLRWATDETLSYLQWLNRFLEAEVKVDPTKDNSDGES